MTDDGRFDHEGCTLGGCAMALASAMLMLVIISVVIHYVLENLP
jgi:hypothetical protein